MTVFFQIFLLCNIVNLLTIQSYKLLPVKSIRYKSSSTSTFSRTFSTSTSASSGGNALYPDPSPGVPVLKTVDKETNIAYMSIALTGEQTSIAFTKSCEMFNEEVKSRGYKTAGVYVNVFVYVCIYMNVCK